MGRGRTKKTKEILSLALAHVRSVPYRVSLRWLFYRLVQDGVYSSKTKYDSFKSLMSSVRKNFEGGWTPDTLQDTTRAMLRDDIESAALSMGEIKGDPLSRFSFDPSITHWTKQERYVQLWFEAGAMVQQFMYYTEGITLVPFRGDASIPLKWDVAKSLESAAAKYKKPVTILYFGDLDKKGEEIPYNAAKDVWQWCRNDFEFVVCGLTPDQVSRMDVPENPEKPGEYQWEALTDIQAREIINDALDQYVERTLIEDAKTETEKAEKWLREYITEATN